MTYEEIRDKLGWDPVNTTNEEFLAGMPDWMFDGEQKYSFHALNYEEREFLYKYLREHRPGVK